MYSKVHVDSHAQSEYFIPHHLAPHGIYCTFISENYATAPPSNKTRLIHRSRRLINKYLIYIFISKTAILTRYKKSSKPNISLHLLSTFDHHDVSDECVCVSLCLICGHHPLTLLPVIRINSIFQNGKDRKQKHIQTQQKCALIGRC